MSKNTLVPVAVVTLVALGESGELRFRSSFEVGFVVLAGVGVDACWRWLERRRAPATAVVATSRTIRSYRQAEP